MDGCSRPTAPSEASLGRPRDQPPLRHPAPLPVGVLASHSAAARVLSTPRRPIIMLLLGHLVPRWLPRRPPRPSTYGTWRSSGNPSPRRRACGGRSRTSPPSKWARGARAAGAATQFAAGAAPRGTLRTNASMAPTFCFFFDGLRAGGDPNLKGPARARNGAAFDCGGGAFLNFTPKCSTANARVADLWSTTVPYGVRSVAPPVGDAVSGRPRPIFFARVLPSEALRRQPRGRELLHPRHRGHLSWLLV